MNELIHLISLHTHADAFSLLVPVLGRAAGVTHAASSQGTLASLGPFWHNPCLNQSPQGPFTTHGPPVRVKSSWAPPSSPRWVGEGLK